MLWIMGRFGAVPEMEWRSQRYARAGWCFSASKAPDRRKKSEFRPIFDQIWLLNQTLDATFVFRDATFVFRRKHDLTFAKVSSTFVSKFSLTFEKTFAKVCLRVTSRAVILYRSYLLLTCSAAQRLRMTPGEALTPRARLCVLTASTRCAFGGIDRHATTAVLRSFASRRPIRVTHN